MNSFEDGAQARSFDESIEAGNPCCLLRFFAIAAQETDTESPSQPKQRTKREDLKLVLDHCLDDRCRMNDKLSAYPSQSPAAVSQFRVIRMDRVAGGSASFVERNSRPVSSSPSPPTSFFRSSKVTGPSIALPITNLESSRNSVRKVA